MKVPHELLEDMHTDICASLLCRAQDIPRSAIVDSLGFHWCKDCTPRQYLIDWGNAHNWTALSYDRYAVAEGLGFWSTAALLGDDDYICALLAATAEYDRRAA